MKKINSNKGLSVKSRYLQTICCMVLCWSIFTACDGQTSITSTTTGSTTPNTIMETASPTTGPTFTTQFQTTSAINFATPTVIPSPTVIPTSTVPPSPTPIPSPTPVPIPTSLLLGQEGNEWGQITVYQPQSGDKLEALALDTDLQNGLEGWFQDAPMLLNPLIKNSAKQQYLLKIDPQVNKSLTNGVKVSSIIGSDIRAKFGSGAGTSLIKNAGSALAGIILRPDQIIGFLEWINSQFFQPDISNQLNILIGKVDEIKEFLQDKERASVQGNLNYLNDLAGNLSKFKINDNELEAYLNQLETIERESLQTMTLLEGQLNRYTDDVNNLTFDKTLLVFRNEDQVKKLNEDLVNYKNIASTYETLLLVRGLAGEIRCALPFSREVALSRLNDTKQQLAKWQNNYSQFLDLVDQKFPQMTGLFADSKVQDNLKEISKQDKSDMATEFTRADNFFTQTITNVNAQIQQVGQPLLIIGELNTQGKLTKVSKLIQ